MNLNWLKMLVSLIRSDKGVTAIEYGLICALMTVVIIGSISFLGNQIENTFNTWSTAVSNAVQGAGS